MPYAFQALFQYLSTLATVASLGLATLPVLTIFCSRPGWGMTARSGGLPPETRTGSCDSKSLEPSYEMVMPVHRLKSAHDFCSESDSGLMIDANMVTLVPAWPAKGWILRAVAGQLRHCRRRRRRTSSNRPRAR